MKPYEIWDKIKAILDSDDTDELKQIRDLLNKELKD